MSGELWGTSRAARPALIFLISIRAAPARLPVGAVVPAHFGRKDIRGTCGGRQEILRNQSGAFLNEPAIGES